MNNFLIHIGTILGYGIVLVTVGYVVLRVLTSAIMRSILGAQKRAYSDFQKKKQGEKKNGSNTYRQ